ncbi:unnamed protein product [Rhizoctonia solani]|uniref:RRM domain-containing protein n=1 Tax=Rhizoctonia solani TaxID=456999 RepID=A0A8H3DQE3_9AGAM|nr:unnamed protein product [Rhizoctonia solani]
MSAELDKSLDQIMQSRPKNRRGAGRRSSAPASTSARQRYAGAAPDAKRGPGPASTAGTPAQSVAQKIMVSGLPPDVNEEQIKELFQSTVGALSSVQLNFDSQGRSKGTATVIFQKKGDANKAFAQYNNRLIDGTPCGSRCGVLVASRFSSRALSALLVNAYGPQLHIVCPPNECGFLEFCHAPDTAELEDPKSVLGLSSVQRPMKIEIVMDPTKVPPPSLASRVAPAPDAKQPAAKAAAASGTAAAKTGKPAARGRGRRRKNNERPAKSVADLDAEMEVYKANPEEASA